MLVKKAVLLLALLCVNNISFGHTTQRPVRMAGQGIGRGAGITEPDAAAEEDNSNPLFDVASIFIQEALKNQNGNGNGAGLAGVASLIGTFIQGSSGESGPANGAMQILSGIGSLLASAGSNNKNVGDTNNGFDPSIIGNVIEMFTNSDSDGNDAPSAPPSQHGRNKREADSGLDSILQIASAFMNSNSNQRQRSNGHNQQKRSTNGNGNRVASGDNGFMSLLPLVIQAVTSFAGPEGQQTQEKHTDHHDVLPPFLEHIHILWDHFSNSELAEKLYEKSGINKILKGFKGRDGHLDYDKLFESLNNQSFRRRWIKAATLYLADWASYLANPEVYSKYFQTAQLMFNGFLKSQGYPKNTFFDPTRPSEENLSNLLDHVAKQHLSVKIDSRQYVKPAVGYARDLLKLGQARGLLQFNATDISDKLTDTLNLEVIEPVLKVHRAYRYISKTPHCDRYVLCQLNSPEPEPEENTTEQQSRGFISGVSPKIVKIGSMGAAIFISTESGTPFWTLFNVINSPTNCEVKYPVDCNGFHEGEARVTTEYQHNEL